MQEAVTLPAVSRIASAQAYPTRPVRLIVGAAGGGNGIVARLMGQWLSERLGQPFVTENRPGGGSNIATEAVVRAPADGYTLLLIFGANAINATLYEKLSFNLNRDIVPVAGITRVPEVMVGEPLGSIENRPRVRLLCQSQCRQAEHGIVWYRNSPSHLAASYSR